jgi:hypothetical protein
MATNALNYNYLDYVRETPANWIQRQVKTENADFRRCLESRRHCNFTMQHVPIGRGAATMA